MTDETLKAHAPTYRISVHMFDETDGCFSKEVRYEYDLKKQEAYKRYQKYIKGSDKRGCTQRYKTGPDIYRAGLRYSVTLKQCGLGQDESDIILDRFYTRNWGDCRTT